MTTVLLAKLLISVTAKKWKGEGGLRGAAHGTHGMSSKFDLADMDGHAKGRSGKGDVDETE